MPNLLEVPAGATIRIARTIGSTVQNEQLGKVGFVPLAATASSPSAPPS